MSNTPPADGAAGASPLVSVCVTTFRRAALLDELLASLAALDLPDALAFGRGSELIVVDNDAAGSGSSVVASWVGRGLPVRYEIEPEQNISRARNRAVAAARAPWIAFVDDDERVEPGWLVALLDAAERYDAQVVFGAVLPVFARPVPDWLADNPYFTLGRLETGTLVDNGGAGNCLLHRESLRLLPGAAEQPFDIRLGRTGGEDAYLFDRLRRAGARLVFCADARAHEHYPAERLEVRWVLRRAFRTGNLFARRQVDLAHRPVVSGLVLALRATAVVGLSLARAAVSRDPTTRFANVLRAISGVGQLTGLGRLPVRGY